MNGVKTFLPKFGNDWSMNLVSMLTYSLITTLFPLLLGILTIAALILGNLSPQALDGVVSSINNTLPQNFQQVVDVRTIIKALKLSVGPLTVITLVSLLFTGSNLFTNMENAFSVIYRVKDRDFLPQRVMGMGMVLLLAILLPASLIAASLVTAGSSAFATVLPSQLGVVFSIIGPLTSLVILWLLFLSFYMIVPNLTVPFRNAWRGAAVAAVIFAIIQLLFPLYFKVFLSGNQKFGAAAASLLVLITWLWFFCLATVIGAQINAVVMGIKPLPYDVARTLADEYTRLALTPVARKKRGLPLPRPDQISAAGRGVGTVAGKTGGALAGPLRILALAAWVVTRPFVRSVPSSGD